MGALGNEFAIARQRFYRTSQGGSSVMDLMCVAEQNGGLYVKANGEDELVEALEKTLDCPMVSQAPLR
jgi:hypothetical protein